MSTIKIKPGIYRHNDKNYTFLAVANSMLSKEGAAVLLLDGVGLIHYVPMKEFLKSVKYPDAIMSIAGLDHRVDQGYGPQFVHVPEQT